MKKVVQFVFSTSVYNIGLQKALQQSDTFNSKYENISIDIEEVMHDFEHDQHFSEYSGLSKISKLIYWIRMNKYLMSKYAELKGSIVNIQFVSVFYVMILPFLKETFDRIVLSFWGSDLLRQSRMILFLLRALVRRADAITFETSDMVNAFRERFGRNYDDRLHIIKFGNYYLDYIDNVTDEDIASFANKYSIDMSKRIVAVGYNRFFQHRHVEAIRSIRNSGIDKEKLFIIIPWTYGPEDSEYKESIESELKDYCDHTFITEHLSNQELATLRKITDVQIIVQTTDALNGTMLEIMYAGGEVIIGAWLKYEELYERGIKMHRVENIKDVGKVLGCVLEEPLDEDKRSHNRGLIKEMFCWKSIAEEWIELY